MQTPWQTMWSFKTKHFRVAWDITPDEDCDASFDETGETAEKIASGEWSCFVSRVIVELNGREVGCDYLGNSIYETPAEFRDHIGARGKYGSYFTDMVRSSIAEARKNVAALQSVKLRAVA